MEKIQEMEFKIKLKNAENPNKMEVKNYDLRVQFELEKKKIKTRI